MKSLHTKFSTDPITSSYNYYDYLEETLIIAVKDDIFFDLHVKVEPELKKIRDTIFHIIINL
jgi:hypothetical protein